MALLVLAVELVVCPVVGRTVQVGKHGPKNLFSLLQVLDRSSGPCSRVRGTSSCLAMKIAAASRLLWTNSLIIAA